MEIILGLVNISCFILKSLRMSCDSFKRRFLPFSIGACTKPEVSRSVAHFFDYQFIYQIAFSAVEFVPKIVNISKNCLPFIVANVLNDQYFVARFNRDQKYLSNRETLSRENYFFFRTK